MTDASIPALWVTCILKSGCALTLLVEDDHLVETWLDEERNPVCLKIVNLLPDPDFNIPDTCNWLDSYSHTDVANQLERVYLLAKNRADNDDDVDPEIEDWLNNHGQNPL